MNPEVRLRELGLELPEVPKPVAKYVPAKRVEELLECGRSCRRTMRVWRRPRPWSVTTGLWKGIGRGAVTTQDLILWIERSVRAPAYCTGVGKAILAFLPSKRLKWILAQVEFKKLTANTITNREKLLAELATVRERGFAVDRGEHEEEIHCVAAPVFDLYGEPIASMSVTEVAREVQRKEEWYACKVIQVAQAISGALGQEREHD